MPLLKIIFFICQNLFNCVYLSLFAKRSRLLPHGLPDFPKTSPPARIHFSLVLQVKPSHFAFTHSVLSGVAVRFDPVLC